MAPAVDLMTWATPELPMAAWALDGQLMVEALPSFHALPAASSRNKEKFCVVPDESDRTASVIAVLGSLTPGLIAAISGAFHFVTLAWKMSEITAGVSCSGLLRPDRLYDKVMGPITTGKYSTVLPLKSGTSVDGIGESEPAKFTVPAARFARPVPEPTPA